MDPTRQQSQKAVRTLELRLVMATAFACSFAQFATSGETASDCCADIESRLAELNAIGKGNRAMSLEISGQVHRALLHWSDGQERNTYSVDPTSWGSYTDFEGDAELEQGWEAGFLLQLEYPIGESAELNQDLTTTPATPVIGAANIYLEQEDLGRITIGFQTEAHDHVTESDLSGTDQFSGPATSDWNGGFRIVGPSSGKVDADELTWSSIGADNIGDGDDANAVRYDTPEIQGFQTSVSWAQAGVAALGLRYSYDGKLFGVEAGAAAARYNEPERSPCIDIDPRSGCTTIAASISVLHKPSLISLTLAGAQIVDDPSDRFLDLPGPDRWFYGKVSQKWSLFEVGATTFYGEYFRGLRHGKLALEDNLGGGPEAADFSATTEAFGVGIMQSFDAAELQTYIAWRSYTIGGEASIGPNGRQEALDLDGFTAIMAGSRISF